MINNHPYTCRP